MKEHHSEYTAKMMLKKLGKMGERG